MNARGDVGNSAECIVEKTRKPLAKGNVYQFHGYPTKIKIKYVAFRGHSEDDGGLQGVAVQWIGSKRMSMFYPCGSDEEFWSMLIFRNAFDPVNAQEHRLSEERTGSGDSAGCGGSE